MQSIAKYIPLLMNANVLRGKKRWVSVFAMLFFGYQLFSPNGIGADWGIPSLDTFYKEPRDVLITRVKAASDAQQETAQEFRTALETFKTVIGFDGGDLEKQFNTLNNAFESSEAAAQNVNARVDRVVSATNRLLDEWKVELSQYHDPIIKRKAESQYDATRVQAQTLISVMRQAHSKTEPVLAAFRDQVLFLKHNLNTQAISALSNESAVIENDVAALIADMEQAIAQAQTFVQALSD